MKVLMLLTKQTTGGTIQLCYQWSRVLQDAGHEVQTATIIHNDDVADSPVVAAIENELGGIVRLGYRRRSDIVRTVYRLRGLIRDYDPDVVHTYFPLAERTAALAYRGKAPIIGSIVATNAAPLAFKSRLAECVQGLTRVDRSPTRWLAVSHAVAAQAITRGYPRDRLEVVYPYFDIDSMRKSERPITRLGQLNEIEMDRRNNSGDKFVVSIGRLVKVRQFDLLIEAFTLLPSRYRLYLVGDGPVRVELESLIARHNLADRVRLLGYRDDVAELLGAADLFVSASLSEGLLGYSTIEAIAKGIPVAIGDIPAVSEVINEKQAYLFDPTNVSEIARVVLEASTASDVLERRDAARRRLDEVFNRDTVLKSLLRGYGIMEL